MTDVQRYLKILFGLIAVAIAVSLVGGWPLGYVAAALLVGWPMVGTLVTIGDDLPGGWSNPDGKAIPEWKTLAWHVEILLCRGSIVLLAFAFQLCADVELPGILLIVAVAMGVIGFRYVTKVLRQREGLRHEPASYG